MRVLEEENEKVLLAGNIEKIIELFDVFPKLYEYAELYINNDINKCVKYKNIQVKPKGL